MSFETNSDARPAEGSSVGVSMVREAVCKLADTSITLELEVHGTDTPRMNGCAFQKKKRGFPSRVRICYASADLAQCRMDRCNGRRDLIWIDGVCFVVDAKDAQRIADWFVTLGIRIEGVRS